MGGWPGGGEELEIRLSSGQRKLELGLGLSLATNAQWTNVPNTLCLPPRFYRSWKKGSAVGGTLVVDKLELVYLIKLHLAS